MFTKFRLIIALLITVFSLGFATSPSHAAGVPTKIKLIAHADPGVYGQHFSFTVKVDNNSAGKVPVSGTVCLWAMAYYKYGYQGCADVDSQGNATITTFVTEWYLSVGQNQMKLYFGSNNYLTGADSQLDFVQNMVPYKTDLAIVSAPLIESYIPSVTLPIQMATLAPSKSTVNGDLYIVDGNTIVAHQVVSTGYPFGAVNVKITNLSAGDHIMHAYFNPSWGVGYSTRSQDVTVRIVFIQF